MLFLDAGESVGDEINECGSDLNQTASWDHG